MVFLIFKFCFEVYFLKESPSFEIYIERRKEFCYFSLGEKNCEKRRAFGYGPDSGKHTPTSISNRSLNTNSVGLQIQYS